MRQYLFCIVVVCITCLFFAAGAYGQERNDERKNNARGSAHALTEDQRAAAKQILSKFNAAALTAEDAKAIHRALRDAGIRGGRAVDEVLSSSGFDPEVLKKLDPPPERRDGNPGGENRIEKRREESRKGSDPSRSKYSLDQAVSDNAQLSTIAFNGLAFLTGDFGAATFIPPGKVCDFFGFQYMRDIDAAAKGHNPVFLNRVAGNVLHVLNDEQKKIFWDLAEKQSFQLEALAKMRLPLIKAFYMERDNQIPADGSGLNKEAVMRSVAEIFALDAELSLHRAETMARIALSLTPEQKAYLAKMKFGDFNTWPALDERDKLQHGRGKSKMFNVAYMTYASEFFSWIAGSEDADTYFCPERHGTYFGGFYMKDMPAMGKRDYDISTSVTGDKGKAFLSDVLTSEQRKNIEATIDLQRSALAEIIKVRRAISRELRKYLTGQTPEAKKVLALGRRYGELDGEVSWYYATAFARVNRTLTEQQHAELMKLRNLSGYQSAPYYIYSDAAKTSPDLPNVNSYFFPPQQEK